MPTPTEAEAPPEPEQGAELSALLRVHGIGADMWDIIMFGDGSGSSWPGGGGFACMVIERSTKRRQIITGAFSHGTSQLMELYPYVHAAYWIVDNIQKTYEEEQLGRPLRIHVFSDSDLIVKQGQGVHGAKKMGPLWASLDDLAKRFSLALRWHWAPRDRWGLNVLCDHLSRSCRLSHRDHCDLQILIPNLNVMHINPGP